MNIKPKIIAFGATGFIGQSLIRALSKNGYDGIWTGLRNSPPFEVSGFKYFSQTELNKIPEITGESTTCALYLTHIGPTGGASTDVALEELFIQQNVLSLNQSMDSIKDAKIKNFIHISSGGTVYGKTDEKPILEIQPLVPISIYGKIKVQLEQEITRLSNVYSFPFTILRPSNIYGPGQKGMLVSTAIKGLKNSKTIQVFGKKGVIRDFLYIDCFIHGLTKVIEQYGENETYNISSQAGTNTCDLIHTLGMLLKIQPKIEFSESRKSDVPYNVLDNTKFSKRYNWKPEVSLNEGLSRSF